jgi:hypothetical protein
MRLNHLNLTVTEPIEAQRFLAKYFGMQPMGKPNDRMTFLTDYFTAPGGFTIEVLC